MEYSCRNLDAYIPFLINKQEEIEINQPQRSSKLVYGTIVSFSPIIEKAENPGRMPQEDDDMEINTLRKELEISAEKIRFLEKDNQELRQEVARLKLQINSLKSHNNERKSLLWKKFQNSMDATFTDSSPQKPEQIPTADKPRKFGDQTETTEKMEKNRSMKQIQIPVWSTAKENQKIPAPPPPPLPSKLLVGSKKVRRVPEVLELYRSLTKRDAQKESKANRSGFPALAFTKNMIGEIENRSAYLSAIKMEVEKQGEFINLIIKEVETAALGEITEVEAFVKWVDTQLSSLVDERAVLKHFPNWPERKADALREAAFTYRDLKSLESEVSLFRDNPKQDLNLVLKRAQALQDRLEESISNVERNRDFSCKKFKEFMIPWEWMMDSGFIGQMKLSSLRLAKEYMKRITKELQSIESSQAENLLLQAVRFAYRVHQYAGGFDSEAILAFEGLKKAGLQGLGK